MYRTLNCVFQLARASYQFSIVLLTQYTARRNITRFVIGVAKLADSYALAAGSMRKLSISNVNARMGNAASACIEEYQISDSQVLAIHMNPGFSLTLGSAWKVQVEISKHIQNKSGAIKSACRCSAPFVRRSYQLLHLMLKIRLLISIG